MIRRGLQLSGRVEIADDPDDLHDRLAGAMWSAAKEAIAARGVYHLALSGGSTPEPFYMHMVIDLRYRLFPWEKTHIWLVDERRVPFEDERSNGRMIYESLTSQVPTPAEQVHFVPTEADDPAAAYEATLRDVFEGIEVPRLDFVLLGMGGDGHTASLFPHSPALDESTRLIVGNDGPGVIPPPRVTMTYRLLNAAREIVVLVAGATKAPMLQQIDSQLRDEGLDVQRYPITGVAPEAGDLIWLLDRAAAGVG